MIKVSLRGDFSATERALNKMKIGLGRLKAFEKYGQKGVDALRNATPVDSGLTASSWYYEVVKTHNGVKIQFCNSNIQNGWAPIAILLQYGHATRNGGYVQGRDYINPAIQPLFDQMADDAWKEVTRS